MKKLIMRFFKFADIDIADFIIISLVIGMVIGLMIAALMQQLIY